MKGACQRRKLVLMRVGFMGAEGPSWRQEVRDILDVAQTLLLYRSVMETAAAGHFLKFLAAIEARSGNRARSHFADMHKAMWPAATSWRQFVQLQV